MDQPRYDQMHKQSQSIDMNKLFTKLFYIFGALLLAAGLMYLASPKANAAFEAGRIIDDGKFTNNASMSAADIQNWLGEGGINSTCLKNYQTASINGNNSYGGNVSAATAIKQAADLYGVNPQVLIVTLQKEQGLVTRGDCPQWRYNTAMGFGCPDGGSCDAEWYGLSRQLYQGARHLKGFYNQNDGWYIPFRPGVRYIPYHPNGGCGGTNVNIVNRATASLYSYTPYQPNGAALATRYGSGDGCSSYGNRNFYYYFIDWFGSNYDDPYRWEYAGQSSSNIVVTGQKATWTVSARNVGTATWYNSGANPVMLGTSNTRDRSSAFCTSAWYGCSRAAKLNEASVAVGAIGTFTFEVQAPNTGGTYNEYFNLVAEGAAWMNDPGLFFQTPVAGATLSSSVVSNNFPTTITAGANANVSVVLRNTGTAYWYNNGKFPVNLGTYNPIDRTSVFATPSWLSTGRPAKMTEATVAPGQDGTFSFAIKAPNTPNSYNESFSLVADGWAWFNQPTTTSVVVGAYVPPAEVVSTLSANQTLVSNQVLRSQDSRYRLVMQSDGNLVLYSPNRALWSTRTPGTPANLFVVQGDSNLVVYDNTIPRPYWNSGTQGRGGNVLVMQNDGNLVLYNPQGQPVWHTRTAGQL